MAPRPSQATHNEIPERMLRITWPSRVISFSVHQRFLFCILKQRDMKEVYIIPG